MEQKQLDEIDEKYFGEEFIEEEIIGEPKPKEPEREKKESKESPKKLKVTKTTSKKPDMEIYYEENKAPEIKITPAKERPPLDPPISPSVVKAPVKEYKEAPKEPEKKEEKKGEIKNEPAVKIEEPVNMIKKKSSGWKWLFRIVILIILIILVIKVVKYLGNDTPIVNINSTLPDNLNTTFNAQNTSVVAVAIDTNNTFSNFTKNETKINNTSTAPNPAKSKVEFTITAKRWLFEPNKLKVNKGDKVKITLLNPEKMKFNFELKEFGISKEISADITSIEFTASQSGTFKFKCSSCEAWRGMEGTIVVS